MFGVLSVNAATQSNPAVPDISSSATAA